MKPGIAYYILVVIVEGEGQFWEGKSLGLSIVTMGCGGRRGGFSQITLGFSCYIDKAHRAVIFAIAQLFCLS